jgi:hypothetical protein
MHLGGSFRVCRTVQFTKVADVIALERQQLVDLTQVFTNNLQCQMGHASTDPLCGVQKLVPPCWSVINNL